MARPLLVWGLDKEDWTAEKAAINEHGGNLEFSCPSKTLPHLSPLISSAPMLLLHAVSLGVREGSLSESV